MRSPSAPRYEGILPAIETAHAIFGARRYAERIPARASSSAARAAATRT